MFKRAWPRGVVASRPAIGAAVAVVAMLWGAFPSASALSLQPGVEAPPAVYAAGPTRTGKTYVIQFSDPRAVDYLCRLGLGPPPQRGGSWWGCYRPDMDVIIAPAPGSWEERERRRILVHECAHARGWRHNADGYGTSPLSIPPSAHGPGAGQTCGPSVTF